MNIEDAQIRLPAVILKQWVIVGAEVIRSSFGCDGRVEHSTQGDAVHIAGMDTKSDDTARILIHDHKYPVGFYPDFTDTFK